MPFEFRYGHFNTPMRFQFKHASASRRHTENVIVKLTDSNGISGYGEGCPREYVTAETTTTANAFLRVYGPALAADIDTLEDLLNWTNAHAEIIDQNPAAFCALENAAIDLMARIDRQTTEEFLGYNNRGQTVNYTAVMGDTSAIKTRLMILAYLAYGFYEFKVKLSGHLAHDQRRLAMLPDEAPVRVDANNLWQTPPQSIRFFKQLDIPLRGIEEPLQRCDYRSLEQLSDALAIPVILDESLYTKRHLADAQQQINNAIVNIRVSKCGGILRSVELANQCRQAGYDVILGAQVGETSLLTRAALTVGQGLHQPPLAREGAYGNLLLKKDICSKSLKFGKAGIININKCQTFQRAGNGLDVQDDRVIWHPRIS